MKSVNGVAIKNLRQLKSEVDKITEGFVTFLLSEGHQIVFDVKQARQVQPHAKCCCKA